MTDATVQREAPLPRTVPFLLSFVAGYVDSYTYLALFGLFAAQVTGSFVIAGAEFVTRDYGIAGKLLAIVAFVAAAAITAALIVFARDKGAAALPWMLALETALLALFTAMLLFGPTIQNARDWHGIVAGLIAAAAMGTQSVLVRLLMKGIPQTNVMTGNMTQLGIETTELIRVWRRHAHDPVDAAHAQDFLAVRARLGTVLSITIGFILGAACGAAAYAATRLVGAPLAVLLVGALTLWSIWRARVG